jgi:hypothetical protein
MGGCFVWVDTPTTSDFGVKSMDRKARRDNKKVLDTVMRKAKQDMADWIMEIDRMPTETEILAFQAGYISGMNRGANNES